MAGAVTALAAALPKGRLGEQKPPGGGLFNEGAMRAAALLGALSILPRGGRRVRFVARRDRNLDEALAQTPGHDALDLGRIGDHGPARMPASRRIGDQFETHEPDPCRRDLTSPTGAPS